MSTLGYQKIHTQRYGLILNEFFGLIIFFFMTVFCEFENFGKGIPEFIIFLG